jgi:hypothetical protein
MSRYPLTKSSDEPKTVSGTLGRITDAAALYKQAGILPPERPAINRLRKTWRGHSPGAFVMCSSDTVFVFDRNR